MEPLENQHIEKELSFKEQQTLLHETQLWVLAMLKKFSNKENPRYANVPLTTNEALEHNKYGTLTLEDLDTRLYVDLKEKPLSLLASEPNTTERYILDLDFDEGKYVLTATGVQIDLPHAIAPAEEDEFGVAINHTQSYESTPYHAASAAEIQRFADIMQLGGTSILLGFGLVFDANEFEEEFHTYLDDLEK